MGGKHGTPEQRFWPKVAMIPFHECWEWMGARNGPVGYGQLRCGRQSVQAHRLSWEIHNGPIPEGMYVLHRCDNPPCVNPAHLFLGTYSDNGLDAGRKGRLSYKWWTRLGPEVVADLRKRREAGATYYAMAKELGMSPSAIRQAVLGLTWKWVGAECHRSHT